MTEDIDAGSLSLVLMGSPGGAGDFSLPETIDDADADATRRCVGLRIDRESNNPGRVGEAVRLGIVRGGTRVGDMTRLP